MFLCVHPARLSPGPYVSVGGVAVGNFHETIDIATVLCKLVVSLIEKPLIVAHLFSAGSALFWSWVYIRALYLVTVVT